MCFNLMSSYIYIYFILNFFFGGGAGGCRRGG